MADTPTSKSRTRIIGAIIVLIVVVVGLMARSYLQGRSDGEEHAPRPSEVSAQSQRR
jgi:hypothetical protein